MERYRQTGGYSTSVYSYYVSYANGTTSPTYDYTVADANGQFAWMRDYTDNAFLKNQRNGVLTIRPMESRKFVHVTGTGTSNYGKVDTKEAVYQSGCVMPMDHFPVGFTLDESAAITACAVKSRSGVAKTATLSAVSLYELEKTASMFAKTGSRVRDFTRLLIAENKRRNIARARRGQSSEKMADTASSLWLEYRYGWVPLMFDIKGHIKAFQNHREPWQHSRGSASDSLTTAKPYTVSWGEYGGMVGHSMIDTVSETLKVRSGIYYEDVRADSARISSNLGLDLWSTPQIMWEIVPFSFVVDWFIDVGDWLEAIKPKPGIRWLGSWMTVEHECVITRVATGGIASGGTWSKLTCSPVVRSEIRKRRQPSVEFPSLPPQGSGISLIRGISAAALSWQQLRRLIH